jgi:hypothetical protein
MARPQITSYAELTVTDLDAAPVWINCHTADEGRPWNASLFADDGRRVSLIPAAMGLGEDVRRANLDALARTEDQIFPVTVRPAVPGAPTVTVADWFTQHLTWPTPSR